MASEVTIEEEIDQNIIPSSIVTSEIISNLYSHMYLRRLHTQDWKPSIELPVSIL